MSVAMSSPCNTVAPGTSGALPPAAGGTLAALKRRAIWLAVPAFLGLLALAALLPTTAWAQTIGSKEVTSTTATLTIGGWTGKWSYKEKSPGTGSCNNVAAGENEADLSGLSPSTAYTFAISIREGCNTGTDLVGDVSFTTVANVSFTTLATPDIILSRSRVDLTESDDPPEMRRALGEGIYTVRLKDAPTGNVTVAIASSDSGAVSASPASLTFTTANYGIPQTVTLTPLNDMDGADESVTVTHTASGGGLNGKSASLTATVADDDGAVVRSPAALTLDEGGAAKSVAVSLAARPAGAVTVSITNADCSACVSVNPASLSFTTANWNTPQSVTVTPLEHGGTLNSAFDLTLSASGGGYGGKSRTVGVVVLDNDGNAGLTLSKSSLALTEGSGTGTFTVALSGTAPSSSVEVSITSGDTGAVTVSPDTLTFTSTNHTTPQTVTVRPVHDADAGNESVTITANATGNGHGYERVTASLTATVTDDLAGSTASLTASKVTETAATLTIANHTGGWYHMPVTPGGNCSTQVTGTTANLTGLNGFTQYVWKAYSDSTCTTPVASGGFRTVGFSASNPSQTTAVLSLANWASSSWWYAQGTTSAGCTERQGPKYAVLENLHSNTNYSYTAYGKAGCNAADKIADVEFNTLKPVTLAASSITASGATLTIANLRKGRIWFYKGSQSDAACTFVGMFNKYNTATLTGLTASTSYTYKAYDDVRCNTELASRSFSTPGPGQSGETLRIENIRKASAELTLLYWTPRAPWSYKLAKGGSGTCFNSRAPEHSPTTALLNLRDTTSYTVTAHSGADCAGANLLDTETFTTRASDWQRPALSISGVTRTGATLSIANHTGDWWYMETASPNVCTKVDAGTSSVTFTNLTPNTYYEYGAQSHACDYEGPVDWRIGDLDDAENAEFTTAPGKPTKPTAAAGAGSGKLTVSASVDGDGVLTKWQYRQKAASDTDFGSWIDISSSANPLSHTVSGLTDGTNYQFRVRAVNAGGTGEESDASDAAQPSAMSSGSANVQETATAPLAPGKPATVVGDGQVELTWTSGGDGGSPIAAWEVSWERNGSWGHWNVIPGSGPDTRSETETGLVNGDTYRFMVRAVNTHGTGPASPPSDAAVPAPPGPPLAPGKPAAVVGDGQVELTWTSGGDGGSPITAWEVSWERNGSWGQWNVIPGSGPDTRSETETGLVNGDTYRFMVRAVNAHGTGPASPPSDAAVPAPAALSVADAKAAEPGAGQSAALEFAVTLNRAASETVTVDYATADGTATAGSDYTATSGTLSFAAGETKKTVSVQLLADAHDDGGETMTLTLSNASGASISDAQATGTITNDGPLQREWLARFGRAAASEAIAAITARLETPRDAGSHLTVGGQRLPLDGSGDAPDMAPPPAGGSGSASWLSWSDDPAGGESRTMSGRELLLGTSFRAVLGSGEGAQFTSWGQGASVSQFSSAGPGLSLSGETATGSMGMDWERGRLLTGFAMTHSTGEGTAQGSGRSYVMGSTVTTMLPYARLALSERVSAWGLAGTGSGRLTLDLDGSAVERYGTDLSMTLAAVGVGGELLTPAEAGGFALGLKADGFWVRTESESVSAPGVGNLSGARADASRVRAVLDGSRVFALAGGATLTPSLELGLRHDGGDAETGTGMEFGAGLGYADPSRGLDMAFRVQGLAAHAEDGYSEWSVSGSLRLVPGGAGRGLSASLVPSYGADPGATERLWAMPDAAGLAANDAAPLSNRLDGELGYGIAMFGDRFTGTPNVGFGLSDTAHEYRAGWRLSPAAGGGFEFGLDAVRREAANDNETGSGAEHRLGLRLNARF